MAAAADVATITHGRAVDLEAHLTPGKYVLFDFYADWCGPCRALEPHLLELADRHADRLSLRKVDIVDFDSAVARQHRIGSVPHLVLYGPDGARIASGDAGSVLRRLTDALGDPTGFAPPSSGSGSVVPLLAVAVVLTAAIAWVARRRRAAVATPPAAIRPTPVDTAQRPGDPAIWFALLQGSLDGPFTRAQLADLARRGVLGPGAEVRRRGDADWSTLGDVLD
jgi:thiol-disulfide isomerase/thioredoxin